MYKKRQCSVKYIILIWVCFFSYTHLYAQLADLARLEYSFIPKSNSEDDYNKFRGLVNFPIKIKEDHHLIVGAEYNRIILDLNDIYPFDVALIRRIHVIDASIGYTFKLNDRWRLGAKIAPRIASTLSRKITVDDLFINGGFYFINDRTKDESVKKPYRLILGLTYNSTTGFPYPLPFVNYHRDISDNWSFSLGVPKTNLKYSFNEKNIIQAFITLDGYFANIQKPIMVNQQVVDNISLSVLVGGLGYEYCFSKHLISYVYTGYTFSLKNDLNDSNRNQIFSLNDVKTFYLRTGIKFKI